MQHGTSFLEGIRALIIFFGHIHGNQPRVKRPRLIALSATFPTHYYIRLLSTLLTVDLSIGNCILRGFSIELCQREIDMHLVSYLFEQKSQYVAGGI